MDHPRCSSVRTRAAGGVAIVLGLVLLAPLGAQPLAAPSAFAPTRPLAALPTGELQSGRTPYPGTRGLGEIPRGREFGADVVGWLALGRVLWSSGYDQVAGSPKVWPQDAESFGRRFVTRSAQLVTIETTRHAAAAVLGRDPAYVRCACDGVWRRLGHVTLGVLTDFDAQGQRRAAWPRFLGATAGSVVLGQLQPGQGEPETVALRALTTVSASWLGNVAKEFHFMPGPAKSGAERRASRPPASADRETFDTAAFTRSHTP